MGWFVQVFPTMVVRLALIYGMQTTSSELVMKTTPISGSHKYHLKDYLLISQLSPVLGTRQLNWSYFEMR